MVEAVAAGPRGDADEDQRAELRKLLQTKRYSLEWRDQLYADVRRDGLSTARAASSINWLRRQPDLNGEPIRASTDQADRIKTLLEQRIAPGRWARQIRERLAAGTMTTEEADRYVHDLERLPRRVAVAHEGPRPGAAGSDAPDGYFALADEAGRVRCYRIHTLRGGERAVELFTGDKAGQRRRVHGWRVAEVMRQVAADVGAAARRYAVTRQHCSDCNQPLCDRGQPGWAHGIGPDCWRKRQAAADDAGAPEQVAGEQPITGCRTGRDALPDRGTTDG